MLKPKTEEGWQDLEARIVCPRCRRNGREADFLIVGVTADPAVGAFLGHYRCLACRWDFIDALSCPPEEREGLQEIAAWREQHRPSVRLHRLYLRARYGAWRGRPLDPIHRVHAELIREWALSHRLDGDDAPEARRGMEITGQSGATLEISFTAYGLQLLLICMATVGDELGLLTRADLEYVTALFLTPEERQNACVSVDGVSAVYSVHLDPWLRPLPLRSRG